MASKLSVDERTDELSNSNRGLTTTGIESTLTLVNMLDSAIHKESVRKTRLQKTEGKGPADGNCSPENRAIVDFRNLRIKESRGVSTRRLKLKKKVVTATKKVAAVLDQYIPDHIKSRYHVLQQGNEIYDATLSKTNVEGSSNKFYIIQALESDDGLTYMVYNRWGKNDEKGIDKFYGPYTSIQPALDEFEQKFYAKTRNRWSERKHFISKPNYYTWLEFEYGTREETVENLRTKLETLLQKTKLETRTAKFVSLICSADMMKKQMIKDGYNAEKIPLRNLSKAMISQGYEALKSIADVIGQNNTRELMRLSLYFFTIIPHNFGLEKVGKFIINTPQKLKRQLQLVEALDEIEVAPKLLDEDSWMEEDPLLSCYESLHCKLTPVEVDSMDFNMIQKYMKNTHSKNHRKFTVEIVQIFRASRDGEADSFSKFSDMENRMLLWHGAPLTNWTGILSQGLRMPHPKAPLKRYMFGKGVYFADMFSKSANYCYESKQDCPGVLLLCEVALGEMVELLKAKRDADKLPQGKLSTKGVGLYTPDKSKTETLEDGVVVPLGRPKKQLPSKDGLWFNEYIVYNVNQIRMRYVVQVNFKFNKQSSLVKKEKKVAL